MYAYVHVIQSILGQVARSKYLPFSLMQAWRRVRHALPDCHVNDKVTQHNKLCHVDAVITR